MQGSVKPIRWGDLRVRCLRVFKIPEGEQGFHSVLHSYLLHDIL